MSGSYEYLRCRSDRHIWIHQETVLDSPASHAIRYFACEVCDTTKEQVVQRRTGQVLSNRMHYPNGYLFVGKGRQAPAKFRRELVDQELGGRRKLRAVG